MNLVAFPKNLAAFPKNLAAFPTNLAAFPTNLVALPTNLAAFPTNLVAFPTNLAAFPTNLAAFPRNLVPVETLLSRKRPLFCHKPSEFSSKRPPFTRKPSPFFASPRLCARKITSRKAAKPPRHAKGSILESRKAGSGGKGDQLANQRPPLCELRGLRARQIPLFFVASCLRGKKIPPVSRKRSPFSRSRQRYGGDHTTVAARPARCASCRNTQSRSLHSFALSASLFAGSLTPCLPISHNPSFLDLLLDETPFRLLLVSLLVYERLQRVQTVGNSLLGMAQTLLQSRAGLADMVGFFDRRYCCRTARTGSGVRHGDCHTSFRSVGSAGKHLLHLRIFIGVPLWQRFTGGTLDTIRSHSSVRCRHVVRDGARILWRCRSSLSGFQTQMRTQAVEGSRDG